MIHLLTFGRVTVNGLEKCVCVCLEKRDSVCQILRRSTEQTGRRTGTDSQLNDRPLSDQEVTTPLKLQWYEYLTFTSFH